jgi:hypothetical protein
MSPESATLIERDARRWPPAEILDILDDHSRLAVAKHGEARHDCNRRRQDPSGPATTWAPPRAY